MLHKPHLTVDLQVIQMWHILDTAREVASAIQYLNSKRLLHRDLKAESVLLQTAPSPLGALLPRCLLPLAHDLASHWAACVTLTPSLCCDQVADFGLARMLKPSEEELFVSKIGNVSHMSPGQCCCSSE